MTIRKFTQVTTKKGDTGTSKNYSNETFRKDDLLFETLGTNDELSSVLGLCYHHTNHEPIRTIQRTLQDMNAMIATNPNTDRSRYDKLKHLTEADVELLEDEEAALLDKKPIEPHFFLPGSDTSPSGAWYDLARAVARRAERTLVRFINAHERDDLAIPRQYLNRLSDLLFILARNADI